MPLIFQANKWHAINSSISTWVYDNRGGYPNSVGEKDYEQEGARERKTRECHVLDSSFDVILYSTLYRQFVYIMYVYWINWEP